MEAIDCYVVGLHEVRREGVGSLVLGNFTFFWSGSKKNCKTHGVGFLYATASASDVKFTGFSERLLCVTGSFKGLKMAIFVVYFPTLDSDIDTKSSLLDHLSQLIESLSNEYKDNVVVLTDANARIALLRTINLK